jgi:hypothetical protein
MNYPVYVCVCVCIYIYIPFLLHFMSASTRSEIGVSKIVYQLGYLILQCCVDICYTDRRKRKQATRSTHAVLKQWFQINRIQLVP